jgi:translocation and assembly module TamB
LFKANKYVLIFFLFIGVFYILTAAFVQSNYFGKIFSSQLNRLIQEKSDLEISFDNVKLGLLPLETKVYGVKVNIETPDLSYNIKLGAVSFELGLWSLLTNDIAIEMLEVDGAEIIILDRRENKDQEKFNIDELNQELSGLVDRIHSLLPIKLENARLVRSYIHYNDNSLFLRKLDLQLYDSFLALDAQIEEINIEQSDIIKNDLQPDSVEVALEISSSDINIRRLQVWSFLDYASFEGRYSFATGSYNISAKYDGEINRFSPYLTREFGEWASGYIKLTSHFTGIGKDIEGEIYLDVYDFESDLLLANEIEVGLSIKDGLLSLVDLNINFNQGIINLVKPVPLMSLESRELEPGEIKLMLENIKSQNAFYFLRDEFKSVHGNMNGEVLVSYSTISQSIFVVAGEEFHVTDFRLAATEERNIIENEHLDLSHCVVEVHQDNSISLQATIRANESLIRAGGYIGDGNIEITALSENLSIEDLGPIAGIYASGNGSLLLEIGDQLNDVDFKAQLKMKDFEVLDIKLNNVVGNLNFNLKKEELKISDVVGNHGDTRVLISGMATFAENSDYSFDFNVSDLSYQESKVIVPEVYKLLPGQLESVDTLINIKDGRLWGSFENDLVNVRGIVTTRSLKWGLEDFDYLSMSFLSEKNLLSINDFTLSKAGKKLRGEVTYDSSRNYLSYNAKLEDISLLEFDTYQVLNLGLNGSLSGAFVGEGTVENMTGKSELTLSDASIDSISVSDSSFKMLQAGTNVEIDLNVLDILKSTATLNLDTSVDALPSIVHDFSIESNNIRTLLGVLSKKNITDSSLEGEIDISAKNTTFRLGKLNRMNLDLVVNNFVLSKRDEALIIEPGSKFMVIDGQIQNQVISSPRNAKYSLRVRPSGRFDQSYKILAEFNLPARFLELFSEELLSSKGEILGKIEMSGSEIGNSIISDINLRRLELNLRAIDGLIENLNVSLESNERDVKLHSLKGDYGNGEFRADGNLRLDFPVPTLGINIEVLNTFLPVMNRSGVVVSGKFDLNGNGLLPLSLKGRADIVFGEILEDLADFQSTSDDLRSVERFLPIKQQRQAELIEMEIDLATQRPVVVRNNMLELFIEGGGKLTGSIENPLFEGRLEANQTSKFKFKGYEFTLSRGVIDLDRQHHRDGANLDFSGVANIADYRIRLDVNGRSKNVAVGLSSEPPLSQEDIFSLLTLGVTSDISVALEESERQNVARVGLGTLLADQFKLNEGLDSSFGLRLSVLPEFAEEETSLLQGKSAVSEVGTSRFRSATRVRLQKKVTERVDLSVSSTVGGSLDQKQEMNLNFRINNRWSVEGIYEMRASEDDGNENTQSIGADLKYRWAF